MKHEVQLSQLYAIHYTLCGSDSNITEKERKIQSNNFTYKEVKWRLSYLLHKVHNTGFPGMSSVLDACTKHFTFGTGCQQYSETHSLPCSFALDISDELCIVAFFSEHWAVCLFISLCYSLELKILANQEQKGIKEMLTNFLMTHRHPQRSDQPQLSQALNEVGASGHHQLSN